MVANLNLRKSGYIKYEISKNTKENDHIYVGYPKLNEVSITEFTVST